VRAFFVGGLIYAKTATPLYLPNHCTIPDTETRTANQFCPI